MCSSQVSMNECVSCVCSLVCQESRGNMVLIVCRGSCGSLFIGVVIALVDNYQLIDNSQ